MYTISPFLLLGDKCLSRYKKLLLIGFFLIMCFQSDAQCAMCRAVLESEEGQTMAKGINDGIIYLMTIPYVLIAGIGVFIYFRFIKKK